MKSAYQESIDNLKQDIEELDTPPNFADAGPPWQTPADNIALANEEATFFETVGDVISGAPEFMVDTLPKFIAASAIAGVNQLANMPIDLANLAGANIDRMATDDWMAAVSDNLSEFYSEHKEGVDMGGFVASSLVPGLGGIKLLHKGQAAAEAALTRGNLSKGMQYALGLVAPQRQKKLTAAINDVITSDTLPKLTSASTLTALKAGLGQNVLEAAAFETAVAATMNSSPMLEDHDLTDHVWNIGIGAVTFGAIGGAVDAARIIGTVKKASNASRLESVPWTHMQDTVGVSAEKAIAMDLRQLHIMPEVPESIVANIDDVEVAKNRLTYLNTKRAEKESILNSRIRNNLTTLANGDHAVAEAMYNNIQNAETYIDKLGHVVGLQQAAKINDILDIESEMLSLVLKSKTKKGLTGEELKRYEDLHVGYVRNYGMEQGAGLQFEVPIITTLADSLKKGQKVELLKFNSGVRAGDKVYKFRLKEAYDIVTAPILQTNARHIWAQNLPEFAALSTKDLQVHVYDVPLMEKIYREFDSAKQLGIKLKHYDGSEMAIVGSREDFLSSITMYKHLAGAEMLKASEQGVIFTTPENAVSALRRLLGVDFNVVADAQMSSSHGMFQSIGMQSSGYRVIDKNLQTGFNRILLNEDDLTTRPMQDLIQTLKHEEGHRYMKTILQAGGLPAGLRDPILKEMEAISRKIRKSNWDSVDRIEQAKTSGTPPSAYEQDFLDYMYSQEELAADTFSYFSMWRKEAAELAPTFEQEYGHLVREIPEEKLRQYIARSHKLSDEEIAAAINVTPSYLSTGYIRDAQDLDSYLFAMQGYAKDYTQKLIERGVRNPHGDPVNIWEIPQWSKVGYDVSELKGWRGFEEENTAMFLEQQKAYSETVTTAVTANLGSAVDSLLRPEELVTQRANLGGAGPSFLGFANGDYNSLAMHMEWMGNKVTSIISDFKKATKEALEPALYKLGQNQEAAIEFSVLNAKLRAIPEHYILDEAGMQFKHAAIARWEREVEKLKTEVQGKTGKDLEKAQKALEKELKRRPAIETKDAPETIAIKNQDAVDAFKVHVERNGNRLNGYASLRAAQGERFNRDPEVFYPIPVNPKDYPHFAIVIDNSITAGWGRHKTLYATSGKELQQQANKLIQGNPHLQVRYAKDAEQWYKDQGMYSDEKTLTDNYLDITANRKGVSAPYLPTTDPTKIVNDVLNWHMERESGYVRENIIAMYEKQFNELSTQGANFIKAETSKFSSVRKLKHLEEQIDNPFNSYIKTALGLPQDSKYPLWTSMNRALDEKISTVLRSASGMLHSARSLDELERINTSLEAAGYKGAAYDSSMDMFANATMPRGYVDSFVRKANAILSTVTLRWDAINAVNNAVSANVLLGTEAKAIIRAIEDGRMGAEWAALAKVRVPGTDKMMLAPSKLIANSYSRYHKMMQGDPEMVALRDWYKEQKFITSISEQYQWTLDNLTFTGKEGVAEASGKLTETFKKLQRAGDAGEKWTGNRLAEEMNRFVAADVMKQITDLAVKGGIISERESLSYINTFVNRTQGNYLAAQRPGLFKGAVGQSIGLFQTYQFNLMQQLLRHVGEGSAKDAMVMMGLQATIHGMNGLPAFQAINQHIIGNASGNKAHRDMYDLTYGTVGKEAGEWLLYGLGSNALGLLHPDLKFNLYTRGDINPRHITVVPAAITDVPFISAYSKFFGNLFDAAGKIAAGGDISKTLIQGLEHNGISRPLAGIAQALEAATNPNLTVYSTSKKGSITTSNDLLYIGNLARIAGAKPLDEAVLLDATYRLNAYGLSDARKTRALGEAFKTHMIAADTVDHDALMHFMGKYMEYGGKQENFSKWARQLYKSANLSQANQLATSLKAWQSQQMQRVMGGQDFTEE